jgi:SOS-response transcriptional repressor LexA
MLNIIDIIEKLKDVLSKDGQNNKVFDKDVADSLDITQANLATMKTRNKIPFSNILDFCALKKISINWLLYGQDPSSLIDSTDKYWIKYFPNIAVSAGGGAYDANDFYEKLDVPDYFVSILGGKQNIKNIEAINVSGDSMEPTLNTGDIIYLDTNKKDISKDGIYAFTNSNGLFVKRIQKRIDGKIDIISDNKEYSVQITSKNKINIVGKAVGIFGSIY